MGLLEEFRRHSIPTEQVRFVMMVVGPEKKLVRLNYQWLSPAQDNKHRDNNVANALE